MGPRINEYPDVLGYVGLLEHRTHKYMGPRIKEYPWIS